MNPSTKNLIRAVTFAVVPHWSLAWCRITRFLKTIKSRKITQLRS